MEILRSDDDMFAKFGQVYMTTAYPGVVKAWHYHKRQTDNLACISGMMKLVLYDSRDGSPTAGEVMEMFFGEQKPLLVQIPPLVYHGFKTISEKEALVINVPTEVYMCDRPDEFRVDPHGGDVPYDWGRKDG
jgi:dTDP-4-dehydrorhamnose 3,5-epimerase